jgi:membrane associated rhomboid family serine protease
MRTGYGSWRWSATVTLIATLVLAFIAQSTLVPAPFANDYLALSLEGFRRGFVWQLVTFQFMHGGWVHLLVNCWAIYVFGREVESVLGTSRYLTLYFGAGVAGGLLHIFGAWIWPSHLGGAVVGASAGGFGLIAAFAALDPGRQLMMLLFFVIPVKMRARTLVALSLLLAGLGIAFPHSFFGGNVAHAAHLGGILAGIAWIKLGWHRDYVRLPWEGMAGRWQQWHPFRTRGPKRDLAGTASLRISKWPPPKGEQDAPLPSGEFISREVDPILDKISQHGIQSLTEQERRILESARSKMAKR